MSLRGVAVPTLTFALSVGAIQTSAQQLEIPAPGAEKRIGAVTFMPTVDFAVGTDSNVFNSPNQPRNDVTWTVSPKATAALRLGWARVTAKATVDFVHFQQYASESSVNPDGSIKVAVPLNRVQPWASVSFLRTKDRPNLEVDARSLRREGSVAAGVTVRLSGKTTFDLSHRVTDVAFDSSAVFYDTYLQEAFNRTTERSALSVRHRLTPLTTITMDVDTTDERFQLAPVRNTTSIGLIPGVEFASSALISGKASVGYRSFRAADPSMPNFAGPVAAVELGYILLGSSRITVTANRDVQYSYDLTAPYYLMTGGGGGVMQRVTDSLGVSARIGRYRLEYRSLASLIALGEARSPDSVNVVGVGALYKVGRDLHINLTVDYWGRESLLYSREYSGARTAVSIRYGF
jgi:hypothetical protein